MQSSGASLFAFLMGQCPNSAVVVDLFIQELAPALRLDVVTFLKATISSLTTLHQHSSSFEPERRILFLRNPVDVYMSLSSKKYKDDGGLLIDKLSVLEHVFRARHDLFDLVIEYESLIVDPVRVVNRLRKAGFVLPEQAFLFPRRLREILLFTMDKSTWCKENFRRKWGPGNIHFQRQWGRLEKITYGGDRLDVERSISSVCPSVLEYYSAHSNDVNGWDSCPM